MPACDTCRIRKIRCNRQSPCNACIASKFECVTSLRKSRVERGASLVPISSAIRPKTTSNVVYSHTYDVSATAASPSESEATRVTRHSPSASNELPSVSLVDPASVGLENESALNAHALAARNLLVQTLDQSSGLRNDPDISAALDALRRMVKANKTETVQKGTKLTGFGGSRQLIYELELPPANFVSDVLRKSKGRTSMVFSPPLAFITQEQFDKLCRTVFFRTEDYPTSTAVIVHGSLDHLLSEFKWVEEDVTVQQRYDKWAKLCRTNLEISISNLDLLLPTNMESAQALLLAAAYCMQIGQASVCKKLVVHGCMMVQSLGWHRASSMKHDDELLRQQKLVIFWMLYLIDKNLSLRLGQASLISDHDIDLPLPWLDESAPTPALGRINLWVNAARVMSQTYQQLYSPGALKQNDDVRRNVVQQLLQLVDIIRPKNVSKGDISHLLRESRFPPAAYVYDFHELILKSDTVTYYALLCMIHRATPMSTNSSYDPTVECIRFARLALDCHKECTSALKGQNELWAIYLHWTILNTPFVPFTTLFSHVLTTCDGHDLQRLQDFASSMSDCPQSQPAIKISKLASVFVSVASMYVKAKRRGDRPQGRTSNNSAPAGSETFAGSTGLNGIKSKPSSLPSWEPVSSVLDTFGFAGNMSLNDDLGAGWNGDLENWFHGNQCLMELLENDLSYLDGTAPAF